MPAADIDQPILPLAPTTSELATQSIVPPMTMDAYWLSTYGTPGAGSTNTTYITGHSWEGAEAPFDRLSTHLTTGDTIVVGTATGQIHYVVESITTHDKNTLKDSDIWQVSPQRLVLISCYTHDPWGKNVVITATPARA
ncbi:class F sortase [Kocuria rosea]|uniref:class F sortase n=1 Tax=Kocuria rosea TaxID=1275 RepID=UPI00119D25B1|nr:class F sortase [Kocuria rosea]